MAHAEATRRRTGALLVDCASGQARRQTTPRLAGRVPSTSGTWAACPRPPARSGRPDGARCVGHPRSAGNSGTTTTFAIVDLRNTDQRCRTCGERKKSRGIRHRIPGRFAWPPSRRVHFRVSFSGPFRGRRGARLFSTSARYLLEAALTREEAGVLRARKLA